MLGKVRQCAVAGQYSGFQPSVGTPLRLHRARRLDCHGWRARVHACLWKGTRAMSSSCNAPAATGRTLDFVCFDGAPARAADFPLTIVPEFITAEEEARLVTYFHNTLRRCAAAVAAAARAALRCSLVRTRACLSRTGIGTTTSTGACRALVRARFTRWRSQHVRDAPPCACLQGRSDRRLP